jgi:hypothetical protein
MIGVKPVNSRLLRRAERKILRFILAVLMLAAEKLVHAGGLGGFDFLDEVLYLLVSHPLDKEVEFGAAIGGNGHGVPAGVYPKNQKDHSDDEGAVGQIPVKRAVIGGHGDDQPECGNCQIQRIALVDILVGADIFQEDGDLVGPAPLFGSLMDALVGQDDPVLIGSDQTFFVGE